MKVVVEKKDRGIEYPCLMESTVSDIIVLFYKDREGVVVYSGSEGYSIGHHAYDWKIGFFKPFNDRVILEN